MGKKSVFLVKIIMIQVLLFLILCSNSLFVQAEKTDAGIGFEESKVVDPVTPPAEIKPVGPDRDKQLPHLGQMVTSIILLLIGLGMLVIFIGVLSLKKLCYTTLKEV
ncbi:hypothetical protein IGL98_003267 [Enterococcus sp. DIV0840]|uniref:hypothetical protein n=1 Tax=Enterococcus TaxID=1350 RepID=UPI001A8E98C7|nr:MULTISPECIES: hypothetical protein [Enterococcus]MBO0436034.1 hypothetical protein [Enterococcus sp. DIV0849a]MBO0475383.1 hypothetical protein [Enterococcus ureasiticus]